VTALRIQLHRNAPAVVMHMHTILSSDLPRWTRAGWEECTSDLVAPPIPSLPGEFRTLVCCYGDPRLPTPDELEKTK
jgi:hypothetical protein